MTTGVRALFIVVKSLACFCSANGLVCHPKRYQQMSLLASSSQQMRGSQSQQLKPTIALYVVHASNTHYCLVGSVSCLLSVQGAVMLLFEGVCGRVLHTGDFRYV